MKKWLKKHSRKLMIALSLLFIGNSTWGLIVNIPKENYLFIIIHIIALAIWAVMLFVVSGIAGRIYKWWEKD